MDGRHRRGRTRAPGRMLFLGAVLEEALCDRATGLDRDRVAQALR